MRRELFVGTMAFVSMFVFSHEGNAQTLVAQYQFANAGNLGLDSSAFGNNATNNNVTQALDRFGALSAGNFNGGSSYLFEAGGLTGYDGLPGFTYTAWVNRSSFDAAFGGIVSQQGPGGSGCCTNRLLLDGGDSPYVNAGNWPADFGFGAPGIANDSWVHLVMTADDSVPGNDTKVYLNGAQVWATHNFGHNLANSSLFNTYVGSGDGPDHFFQGLLDDVRIYDGVLTAQQVSFLFQTGLINAPEPSSYALWSMLGLGLALFGIRRLRAH